VDEADAGCSVPSADPESEPGVSSWLDEVGSSLESRLDSVTDGAALAATGSGAWKTGENTDAGLSSADAVAALGLASATGDVNGFSTAGWLARLRVADLLAGLGIDSSPVVCGGDAAVFLVLRRVDAFFVTGAAGSVPAGCVRSGCEADGCGGPAGRLAARRRVRRTGASEALGVAGVGVALDTVVSSLGIHTPQCLRARSAARRRVGHCGGHP